MSIRIIRFGLSACMICLYTTAGVRGQTATKPVLPAQTFDYYGYAVTDLPAHLTGPNGVTHADNTPAENPITNLGATLGRVLFYDRRLSHNDSTACASCHQQQTGFSDPRQFSVGFDGEQTGRHSMALTNAKFYENGRFFWDERAATLEDQVLIPIQSPVEMGMNLGTLTTKLTATSFYPDLFQQAFGSPEVTSERISQALSQFVRSMVSYKAKLDSIYDSNGTPDYSRLTTQEFHGLQLFSSLDGRCAQCHVTAGQIGDATHNIGLDAVTTDAGAGDGKFKTTSLRNVEVRGRFMHDGRFTSLEEVIEFYSTGVQPNPDLDVVLQGFQGNFTPEESQALLAFMKTLTDWEFLSDAKFADPFAVGCDFSGDAVCDITDMDLLYAKLGSSDELFDLDGSGVVDNDDITAWLTQASAADDLGRTFLRGDRDLDGTVNGSDFTVLAANFGTPNATWGMGNFDGRGGDGTGSVGGSDFTLLAANFGFVSSTHVVPEPSYALMAILAFVVIIRGQMYRECHRGSDVPMKVKWRRA